MNPTLSGFALGLLFAAAKVGAIGTIGFGIAWWRTRARLRRLESAFPEPTSLEERLTRIEQVTESTADLMDRLVETQDSLARRLALPELPASRPDRP